MDGTQPCTFINVLCSFQIRALDLNTVFIYWAVTNSLQHFNYWKKRACLVRSWTTPEKFPSHPFSFVGNSFLTDFFTTLDIKKPSFQISLRALFDSCVKFINDLVGSLQGILLAIHDGIMTYMVQILWHYSLFLTSYELIYFDYLIKRISMQNIIFIFP